MLVDNDCLRRSDKLDNQLQWEGKGRPRLASELRSKERRYKSLMESSRFMRAVRFGIAQVLNCRQMSYLIAQML